jgi:hypothetical protein
VKQLTEATAELQRGKEAAEEEAREHKQRLIKQDRRLTAAMQENAVLKTSAAEEAEEGRRLRMEAHKHGKRVKALEESLRMTRAEHERE